MSKAEYYLWGADFVISGAGWYFGGTYAALACFTLGAVLIFFGLSRTDEGDSNPRVSILTDKGSPYPRVSRLKSWHKYGLVVSIVCTVMLACFGIYRYRHQSTALEMSGPIMPMQPLQPLTLSPIKLVFKNQAIGTTSNPQTVTVINREPTPRMISGIHITGNFSQTNDCGTELMIGDSCNVQVTFIPVTVGLTYGDLEISCHDPLFANTALLATVSFSGFGENSPSHHPQPSAPEPVARIHIASQKRIASADQSMPYGLEVVVTTDKDISPVAFNFIFSSEVAKVQAIPVQGIYNEEQGGIVAATPNVVFYQRESPAFIAAVPMVLYVYSRSYIEMKKIESVPFSFPRPASELR
jgi:hypothetical protein